MRKGSKVALISVAALLAIVLLFMGTMAIQVGRHVEMHLITWNGEDNEVFRTQAPIWLFRMSLVNILSNLGVAPARLRLTFADLERFGPGRDCQDFCVEA